MKPSTMIADRPFPEYEPMVGLSPLPQFRGPAVDCGANGLGRMTILIRRGEAGTSQKIEDSIAFMLQHVNQPLQVSTLAARVNISPSHFFALFKRHTGRAPMDYFTQLRMERARRLLDTTNSSVKEVAAALGYDDPFYFSRVFKTVQGAAPSEYRAQQGKAGNRNLKRRHSNEKNPAAGSPPQPPGSLQAREDKTSESLSRGRFRSSAHYPKSFHSNYTESSSNPNQTFPAPVHP